MGKGQSNNQSEGHSYTLILPEDHTWGGLLLFQHECLSEGAISHLITAALRVRLIPFDGFFSLRSDGELWLLCQCTHTGCGGVWSYHFIIHDYYVIIYIQLAVLQSVLWVQTRSKPVAFDLDPNLPSFSSFWSNQNSCFSIALLSKSNYSTDYYLCFVLLCAAVHGDNQPQLCSYK